MHSSVIHTLYSHVYNHPLLLLVLPFKAHMIIFLDFTNELKNKWVTELQIPEDMIHWDQPVPAM